MPKEGILLTKLSDHLNVAHELEPLTLDNLGIEEGFWSPVSVLLDTQLPLKCNNLIFFGNITHYND